MGRLKKSFRGTLMKMKCLLLTIVTAVTGVQAQRMQFQLLHSFSEGPNHPQGGLVRASDGNFYGVTAKGGDSALGTIFKVTLGGVFTIVASFNYANGAGPPSLLQGTDGNFYGTAGN